MPLTSVLDAQPIAAPACSGQAAEPPEAVPGQGQRQGEVDRGLGQLEAPVAAGGLVGDGLPDAVAAQAAEALGGYSAREMGRRPR